MEGLEVGWLEAILKKSTNEKAVVRVLDLESDMALGPGENYSSDILRIKMNAVIGSGRLLRRTLIAKRKNNRAADVNDRYRLFELEIEMYSTILPRMEVMMEEHGDSNDYLWPDYFGSNGNVLIFEDLKVSGFKLADRHSCLDMNHARLVLRNLGRFHGMSVALVNRGVIGKNQFPPVIYSHNDDIIQKFCKGGIQTLADTIDTNWDLEWKGIAAKLRTVGDTIGTTLHELYQNEIDEFKVVNHGDCWINNMLFKFEPGSNYPIGHRFVDYQCCHYGSPAWDLTNFLYSSVTPALRKEKWPELMSAYHESLVSTLKFYGCAPENAPTLGDIETELDRLLVFGLMVSSCQLPITMADPSDAFDMAGFTDDAVEAVHKTSMYLNEKYAACIKQNLEYYIAKGIL